MADDYWCLICWKIILTCWKLFKRHCKEQPVDWQAVHDEAVAIREKYPTRLCEELLIAVVAELERYRGG